MARRYSGAKGRHGSRPPLVRTKPAWLRFSKEEIELLVAKLAKEGLAPAQIGLVLRDSYGIPSVKVIGKSISKILKEKGIAAIPPELERLTEKIKRIKKHIETNKHDMTAKRGLQLTQSKLHRLAKYFKEKGVLPKDWKPAV